MKNIRTIIIAKALVLDEDNNILVLRRSSTHPTRAHQADFPGGKVDFGESFEEALIREIQEETQLKISKNNLEAVYAGTEIYEGLNHVRVFYIVKLDALRPDITICWEHESAEWRSIDQVTSLAQEFHSFYHDALMHISNNRLFDADIL